MPWVKLDEGMPEHHKVVGLSDRAFRAHIEAICYCARNLTNGKVTTGAARKQGWTRSTLMLTDAELWEEIGDGWMIHDYLVYNPSREQVEAERAAARGRMAKARGSSAEHPPKFQRSSHNPSPSPTPVADPLSEIDPPSPPNPQALEVYRNLASSMGIQSPPIGWAEGWLQTRSLADIGAAIDVAREKGVTNTRYLDKILERSPAPRQLRAVPEPRHERTEAQQADEEFAVEYKRIIRTEGVEAAKRWAERRVTA